MGVANHTCQSSSENGLFLRLTYLLAQDLGLSLEAELLLAALTWPLCILQVGHPQASSLGSGRRIWVDPPALTTGANLKKSSLTFTAMTQNM